MSSIAIPAPEVRLTAQRTSLAPRTIPEALDFSAYLAKSDLIPKDYQNKPHNIFVAVQYGMELGLPPMQALQAIAVINGRPSMWGDAVLAVVISHPSYEWHTEVIEGEGEARAGVFTIKRRGQEAHIARFSVNDARKAGLWGKSGPWTQHAERMLKLRARGFALRDKFPDALKGIISREEAEDYPVNVNEGRYPILTAQPALVAPVIEPVSDEPARITQGQAREFAKAWRASGYTVEDAKTWLKAVLGLTSSLAIPADRYEEAIVWAKTPKADTPEPSREEAWCYALFDRLHFGLAERAEAIADAEGDWAGLAEHLRVEMEERKRASQPEQAVPDTESMETAA